MSKIEWTQQTWNPVTGCTKISEGCLNCYAEKMHKRLQAMGQAKYKHNFNEIHTHKDELNKRFGKNKLVFVGSMSDIFDLEVPESFLIRLLEKIKSQKATFQLLTKRPARTKHFNFPENVWLGTTVENAGHKDRINPWLKSADAKTKFISFEPLLGDVGELDLSDIDWVIVGGESGPGARPMHPGWVRNIQKQCQERKVPFFFKQWGEWIPVRKASTNDLLDARKELIITPEGQKTSGLLKYDSETAFVVKKVGKKKAGRLLDGKIYEEYPA